MNKKVPLSIIIPAKNEEANLARCINSVQWADEVFVVDSQSTDKTEEIVHELGAQLIQFHFKGNWPKKKNWALENIPFKNEWVFILDADETLPAESKKEFNEIVSRSNAKYSGYWINRKYHFMGKRLNHCYFPNWNLRLFKHKLGRYEKLTDAATLSGDNEVHEHIIISDGHTGHLKSIMEHYAFPSIDSFVEKHNRYSNWEAIVAMDRYLNKSEQKIDSRSISWKRRLKSMFIKLPFRPTLRFLYVYVFQKGFLDGAQGYHFARLHSFYEYLILSKTRELKKASTESPTD